MKNKQAVPAQAYGYQAQLALVAWCLLKYRDAETVAYENLDDICVGFDSGRRIFIQVKSGERNPFSNSSLDLWKTLSNWVRHCTPKSDKKFIFITTKKHKKGKILSCAENCRDKQDFSDLFLALNEYYTRAKKNTRKVFHPFIHAKEKIIHIFQNIEFECLELPIHDEIKLELKKYDELDGILETLYSSIVAWVEATIEKKTRDNKNEIVINRKAFGDFHANRRAALEAKVKYNLTPPVISDEDKNALSGSVFLRQIDAIGSPGTSKEKAVLNYLKAKSFIDELTYSGAIDNNDINREKEHLIDYWENECLVPRSLPDTDKGVNIFTSCMRYRQSPLYIRIKNESLCQGTYHILADDVDVWWHPTFKDTL